MREVFANELAWRTQQNKLWNSTGWELYTFGNWAEVTDWAQPIFDGRGASFGGSCFTPTYSVTQLRQNIAHIAEDYEDQQLAHPGMTTRLVLLDQGNTARVYLVVQTDPDDPFIAYSWWINGLPRPSQYGNAKYVYLTD